MRDGAAAAGGLCAAGVLGRPFTRVVAVIDGPNPSFDYYLVPRLRRCPGLEWRLAELWAGPRAVPAPLLDGALLLFCRYLTPAWVRALRRWRGRLGGAVLFLDDDLAALARERSLPLLSRLRYHWLGPAQWPRLGPMLDLLWVSTPALARLHAGAYPRLLPPLADAADLAPPPERAAPLTVAYHATAVHRPEHRWLMPVLREALRARPDGWRFEVVAEGRLAAQWRRCPGAVVVPWQPWPLYRAGSARRPLDLLLAPLLQGAANRARSSAKRIDAARSGAALLVSDAAVYQPSAAESGLGMQVPLEPRRWAEAIAGLTADPARLRRLAALNRQAVLAAQAAAVPLFVRAGDAVNSGWQLASPTAM